MCGIVVVAGEKIDSSVLDRMRDRLAHRGPDGARSWSSPDSGAIALGHRRLAIIDLSAAAAQPMFSRDGKLVIVYNGEVYNYIELREELRARGHVFETESDTEVLLAAYAEWGMGCLPRLNGMFAFALWDANTRRLLVARGASRHAGSGIQALGDGGSAERQVLELAGEGIAGRLSARVWPG